MPRKFWWPTTLAEQIALLSNFSTKVSQYQVTLGWTAPQTVAAQDLCAQMVSAYTYTEEVKASALALTQWREMIFNGEPMGSAASPAPSFGAAPGGPFTRGCVQQFTRLRDQILANVNYTTAIGEDLGLVGSQISPPSPESVTPNLKVTVTEGDTVNIAGSMQGASAMRLTYTPQGGTAREVAFITATPAGFTIAKANASLPENGVLRATFYKRNAPYGNPSPIYPITLG